MTSEITIGKNTLVLIAGLVLVVIVGSYLILGVSNNTDQTNLPSVNTEIKITQTPTGAIQEIYLKALPTGDYDKDQIIVKKGIPVRLHFSTQGNVGCGRQLVIRGLNVQAISNGEEQIVEFTPKTEGTYQYTCGMGMWGPGRLVVVS